MRPILFELAGFHVYSYGFMIALGAIGGVGYMAWKGKQTAGFSFDQANTLFLIIFFSAVIGGKLFLFFEDPADYVSNPAKIMKGSGFVFYGSFLFAIPAMLWYFKSQHLDTWKMFDVMAITTCIVHFFGRIGCFLAGCCYGLQTDFFLGVAFHDQSCPAEPKDQPLHPVQLYEAAFILLVMTYLLYRSTRLQYNGQLFIMYLMSYSAGRYFLEFLRGDLNRGFLIENILSNSQLVSIVMFGVSLYLHLKWRRHGHAIGVRAGKI
jgi:phosphatidylglycerol---prolipoprotein diacylglyceryl transferase